MLVKKISTFVVLLGLSSSLYAVDYGGEKSFLVEIPYKVCTIAPLPQEAIEKGIQTINTPQAKKLFEEGAFFYDARREAHYKQAHIKGAKPVIFDASKAQYTVLSLPRTKEKKLVFYCYGESCANSYEAALAVHEYGYKNVFWYAHGFQSWQKMGHPIAEKVE